MKQAQNIYCDAVIAGGGIAGLVTALELLQRGQYVHLVDRDTPERIGGLARWAFGGMALSGTQQQKRMKIPDDSNLLLKDWHSFAQFGEDDYWPKAWAKEYALNNHTMVYQWLLDLGMKFLPAVNWVERGLYVPGNSVPRYHILWGTGWGLIETILAKLTPYIEQGSLTVYHQHKVIQPIFSKDKVIAVDIENELTHRKFSIQAANVIIACGGINGATERVKKNWYKSWRTPPTAILNGANPISDGQLHDRIEEIGGSITHQDKMWNYAAGIPHPQAEFNGHGVSLIPCKSALWLDHKGIRIGPVPLVTGFDTHDLCQQVAKQEQPWTWQILNWKIAAKELAVSGSLHNPSIRDKKLFSFLKEVLLGNHKLVKQLEQECDEFVCADSLDELVGKMNALTQESYVSLNTIRTQIQLYDEMVLRGTSLQNDDQIRRINHARQWQPDKLRTCKPAPILTKGHGKLIAIKLQLISRKSLGGVQTNLKSQVLSTKGDVIRGLYCVGEAAGFGGGGANGLRSLEGTFLSGCILTARKAASAILEESESSK
ncbi:FAD-dependent oxidoreductase [Colwelliaceae bacterium 6471]